MPSKSKNDQGANNALYKLQRDGSDIKVIIIIRGDDGTTEAVHLNKDEVVAATTPAERAGLKNGVDALYAAALTKANWA